MLDIGCGSGEIGSDLEASGHRVVGVEVLARDECAIAFARFDGRRLPFPDDAFDHAVIVDVLHHTADPTAVLAEARRVTTGSVVLKDHFAESGRARFTLGVMDWVGNRQFGVGREGAYLSREQWDDVFAARRAGGGGHLRDARSLSDGCQTLLRERFALRRTSRRSRRSGGDGAVDVSS